MNSDREDPADILSDSLEFLGGTKVVEDPVLTYGHLRLTVAPKEGKAITLLADHLFSPGLFLAEKIERAVIQAPGRNVIELGAGTGLPSLLLSICDPPPASVIVTDYPDPGILGNLARNIERNKHLVSPGCDLHCCGHEWGTDVSAISSLSKRPDHKYDMIILSDLLHFHSSHAMLISSVVALLATDGCVHVAAGYYTKPHVCENFLRLAAESGLDFDEVIAGGGERDWLGFMDVGGLDKNALTLRKAACRYWIGKRRSTRMQ
ncbi:hypothetical protein MIND_00129300 [Mycena indigotica]|uniref:Nicotinamide N-methyltransferase n=1 Tax=Mycena indigotica TaxID=2126181 RepID=A0A8H6WFU0_9AGAR|nr:uncharacterized protein MIND_00129300 [Mycena indigotica]KAF7316112.1 hypothetical protein MIND_00129300 [Mycena indigotica]